MAKDHQSSTSHATKKTPNYYTILNLSPRKHDPTLTRHEVKAAYKRALLQHHPDKKTSSTPTLPQSSSKNDNNITVDSIALAYKILSSPTLKAEYDFALQTSRRSNNNKTNNSDFNSSDEEEESDKIFRTGLETVDLDDLDFLGDDSKESSGQEETWTRACRCGDDGGFVVTEGELDANAEDGEVIVGCRGCSLWLRVLFGVEG